MPKIFIEELMQLKKRSSSKTDLVFHDNGRPLIRKTIGRAYGRAIRKTSATQANCMTGDLHAVSKSLGHSNLEETQKYVEIVDDGKHKVAEALDSVARSVLKMPAQPKRVAV